MKRLFTLLVALSYATEMIPYDELISQEPSAVARLKAALHSEGIVGVRGIPGFRKNVEHFIATAREFSSLPEEVKEQYAPNRDIEFVGYEKGKEKFQRPNGEWVVDTLKTSYYAFVPNRRENKWPDEVDLKTAYQQLSSIMYNTGLAVMNTVSLIFPKKPIGVGRMLHYCQGDESLHANPFWCGAHFDHSVLTALLPAHYFVGDTKISEPEEAGLFVRKDAKKPFQKIDAIDHDVLLFQVGEFGQLATNDRIRATEHRVHRAHGAIDRYTLALFFSLPDDITIHSSSVLTKDARYGDKPSCTFGEWHTASLQRYHNPD